MEYPATVTTNVPADRAAVTLRITGTPASIRSVCRGAGDGVISCPDACSCVVIVMVPATVPVCTPTLVAPTVVPAGTVILAERPPVENWTAGSSGPESGTKVMVRVDTTSNGYGLPSVTCTVF